MHSGSTTRSLAGLSGIAAAATLALLALGALFPRSWLGRFESIDLAVYRMGGEVWLSGNDLYGHLPDLAVGVPLEFTYPPIAAILFSPLAFVPLHVASIATIAVSTALLAFIVWVFLPGTRGIGPAFAIAVAAIVLEPVRTGLGYGQINTILVAVVAADCLLAPERKWRGLGVGVVAAIKLTPLVFLLFFLIRRDVRAMVNTGVGFVGATLAAAALAWHDSVEYWTSALFDTTRIGPTSYGRNQSIHGELARLFGDDSRLASALWVLSALAVVAAVYIAARKVYIAARKASAHHALILVGLCGILISPISWTHHWVWIVPALMVLYVERRWWLFGTGVAIFGIGMPILLSGHQDDWRVWEQGLNSLYVLWAVAYVVNALWPNRESGSATDEEELLSAPTGSPRHLG